MTKHISVRTYVPLHVSNWIKEEARALDLTVSVIVRDILVTAFDEA